MKTTRKRNTILLTMLSLTKVVLLGILQNCIQATNQCSPTSNFTSLSPAERAARSELVIIGTVIRASSQPKTFERFYSACFRVHCVIKGKQLPKFIKVSGFGSVGGICGTTYAVLKQTYVVFLKREPRSGFLVNKVNVQEGSIRLEKHSNESVSTLRKIVKAIGETACDRKTSRCLALYDRVTPPQTKSKSSQKHTKRRKANKLRCGGGERRKLRVTTLTPSTLEATFETTIQSSHVDGLLSTSQATERPDVRATAMRSSGRSTRCGVLGAGIVALVFHVLVSFVAKRHQT